MTKERCKGFTTDKRFPYQRYRCNYSAVKDGYCIIHHPEEKTSRNKKRIQQKEELYQRGESETLSLRKELLEAQERVKELERQNSILKDTISKVLEAVDLK